MVTVNFLFGYRILCKQLDYMGGKEIVSFVN